MAAENPTFVIVPGSLHTPEFYYPTINALQALDYPCVVIFLPNIGFGADTAGPYDSERATRAKLEKLVLKQHKKVVLVGHSTGGVVASQVVKGLERSAMAAQNKAGGIIRVTFLSAVLMQEGQTQQQPPGGVSFMEFDSQFTRPGPVDACIDAFYHDLPEKEARMWAEKLEMMDVSRFGTAVTNTCWDVNIPKTYVFTTQDRALPLTAQKHMFEAVQDESWDTKSLNCGHSPFLSRVDELVEVLISDI
ncbi:MAG: hypothetical protein M1828_003065 [Chrysothrix sp. TS-e1954]|nr:MAG: hypothetical protein M1828_003065 [Chrysothrix sp. TS-e1954]